MDRRGPKIGRNQPCPCGSGLKYKKCHLPLESALNSPESRNTSVLPENRYLKRAFQKMFPDLKSRRTLEGDEG